MRLRPILLLLGAPLLLLAIVDRAVVLSGPHWRWVALEVPSGLLDPYRVEAILRTTDPGPQNVFILGDSTAAATLDTAALEHELDGRGLRFRTLSIGGAPTLTFAFLLNQILVLQPSAIILFVSPYALRSRHFYEYVHPYDARVVRDLFTLQEVLDNAGFHLAGLFGQVNILFRHRRSMQYAAAVRLEMNSWGALKAEQLRAELGIFAGAAQGPLQTWMKDRAPDSYENPNARALDLIARRCGELGVKLLIVETLMQPTTALVVGEERGQTFRARVRAIADARGVAFMTRAELPALQDRDFADHMHMNERGRQQVSGGVAARLREIL